MSGTSALPGYCLAFELSLESAEALVVQQEELDAHLRAAGVQASWVEAERLRVPLKWMPHLEPAMQERLEEAVSHVTQALVPFKVDMHGLLAWPSPEVPRVLYAAAGEGRELVMGLQQVLEVHLERIGVLPDPRPFQPWVVAGRVPTPKGRVSVAEALEGPVGLGSSLIRHVVLHRVDQDRWGVRRQVVKRFRLGGAGVERRRL